MRPEFDSPVVRSISATVRLKSPSAALSSGASQHPYLARPPALMHDDAASTDTVPSGGCQQPKGTLTTVRKRGFFGGLAPTFAVVETSRGARLITAAFGGGIAPKAIRRGLLGETVLGAFGLDGRAVATRDLPPRAAMIAQVLHGTVRGFLRSGSFHQGAARLFRSTTSGAYFFVDDTGTVVVPSLNNRLWFVPFRDDSFDRNRSLAHNGQELHPQHASQLPNPWRADAPPLRRRPIEVPHAMVSALPVWPNPERFERDPMRRAYWWTSNEGLVGVIDGSLGREVLFRINDPHQNPTRPKDAPNETIANSFAVGRKGAFILSDRALYRFEYRDQRIRLVWRHAYEAHCAHPEARRGRLTHTGSGTTPTLMGDDFVAFTDGAAHLCLEIVAQDASPGASRPQGWKVPVLGEKAYEGHVHTGCENSLVVYRRRDGADHEWRIIVGNTWGYRSPFERVLQRRGAKGIQCLAFDGRSAPKSVWTSERSVGSAVPKLSLSTATLYFYELERRVGGYRWSVVGLDAEDGERENYRVELFSAPRFRKDVDNAWGTIALFERGLTIAAWRGFRILRDQ